MNFDEFAFMAETNAKTWFDNYYDMCANEEFGFEGPANPPNLSLPAVNRSSSDDNKSTSTAIVTTTNIMQSGTDTATTTPVSNAL